MYKAIVFAGTTEGYELCRFLAENCVSVCGCVATEYGGKSLEEGPFLHIRTGRLNEEEMSVFLRDEQPELVLDATHPYAAEVTENICSACEQTGVEYQRVLREESEREAAIYVDSVEEAIAYLETQKGNILLTTGSKELKKFTSLSDYENRIYARVLSLPSVLETCRAAGFEGRHLIGMQGPFSRELNRAMLRQYECRFLVTKDGGQAGGFLEKMEAARDCGVQAIVIGRPKKETGLSLGACKDMLANRYGFSVKRKITLLGIGMGTEETLTIEGKKALQEGDLLIGAKRMVDGVRRPGQAFLYEYRSEAIAAYLEAHPQYQKVVIALSGDVGFYSGAKKLLEVLGDETEVLCGISSVVYFMAKIHLSWEDAKIVSAHGRSCNLVSLIRQNPKVFAILGTADGTRELARRLVGAGLGQVGLYVGENLSYENEKIFHKPAEALVDYQGDALSVICACNPKACPSYATHGIPDGEFLRGKAPMTKEEVRTVSLSKLRLREDSICYDVGAGTGSVSVEMALRAHQGTVYAIEKKEEAIGLLKENKKKFGVDHLKIIEGTAPGAMEELPPPTHAFIGGSSGNLREIVTLLLEKNPQVRMVINCITLETLTEALAVLKEQALEETEIVQLSVSRAKELGRYHMMMGENPIYIITCQKGECP